jgi:hypothetical protein
VVVLSFSNRSSKIFGHMIVLLALVACSSVVFAQNNFVPGACPVDMGKVTTWNGRCWCESSCLVPVEIFFFFFFLNLFLPVCAYVGFVLV